MWSRLGRRLDRPSSSPVGQQAGEQHARLHLGARRPAARTRCPRSARAADRERREAARRGPRSRAPICRSGAAMRSTGRRRIESSPSSVHAPPRLPGEPARQQPHQRAGVADVDRPRRRRAPRRPGAADGQRRPAARLDQRARAPARRPASSACRRRRGSRVTRTGSAHIAPISAARCDIDLSRRRARSVAAQRPATGSNARVLMPARPRGRARARAPRPPPPPRSPATHSATVPCVPAPGRAPCRRC